MEDEATRFRKIQEGDRNAFADLFQAYAEQLYLYASGFMGDQEDARDIVQETFIYLWVNRLKINYTGSLFAYLLRAVKNSCIDYKLHEKVKKRYCQETEHLQRECGEEPENFEIQYARLRRVVDSLPPKCREIFILGCVEGLSYKEVADQLGVSVNTVKTQIKVAYKKVKSELSG